MAKHKIQQKVPMADFTKISAQIKAGIMHVVHDPKPGAIKMNHLVGRVTQAFNLGKKIEFETNANIFDDDSCKFGQLDGQWYLIVTSSNKQ